MAERARAPGEVRIQPFARSDLRAGVHVLAAAFRDNPLNVAVIGGTPESRERINAHGMRAHLPGAVAHGRVLAAHSARELVGVLVSTPPYRHPFPAPPLWARLRSLLAQGPGVARRWAQVYRALDALHPLDPHWYLGTLGVAPSHRGRGFGTALLERWLQQLDRRPAPAYLETDRAANLPFYERADFAVIDEVRVLDVPVWLMRRPPRPAGIQSA